MSRPPRIHRRVLSNGCVLLAVRNRSAPTLAIAASVLADQRMEDPARAGTLHLAGACMDEGTRKWTGVQIADVVEGFGGSLASGAGGVTLTAPVGELRKALPLLAEVLRRPTYPPSAVRREKEIARSDILGDMEEPGTVVFLKFKALCYGSHPYARPSKGTLPGLARVTRRDLLRFHRSWCGPERTVVAASGDVAPEAMLDLMEARLGGWKNRCLPVPTFDPPRRPSEVVERNLHMEREQVHAYLGHPGIRRDHPDFYRLLVMDHILGTGPGFTDRISRRLRDEQGLCYTVNASITSSAGLEPGYFAAYIGTSPRNVKRAVAGFLAEIHEIRRTLPTAEELTTVQQYLTGSFLLGLERNTSMASFLVRLERYRLGLDYIQRFPGLVGSVTAEEVREAAARHLDEEHFFLVTAGPAPRGGSLVVASGAKPRRRVAARSGRR